MSDSFEMLVDVDATSQEAEPLANTVVDRLRNLGLISGSLNSDCVLGKMGYRPGPAVPDSYEQLMVPENRFWELRTCGVEPKIGRGFNMWALGPVCEGLTCTSCRFHVQPFDADLGDAVGEAINEWLEQTGPALVRCPRCHQQRSIAEWECKPPLGFGNLSFTFWNWPPLNSSEWKIDIAEEVRDCTGHTIVRTYGHIQHSGGCLEEVSPYGVKYVVTGEIATPSGRLVRIVTVWIVDAGQPSPRLVTAYPAEDPL